MITIPALVSLLIYLVVLGILVAVIFWVIDAIPVPQPLNRIIRIAAVVIVALIAVLLLLQLAGVSTGVTVPLAVD
jgi:hypothetical protein